MYAGLAESPGLPSGKGTGGNPIEVPGVTVTPAPNQALLIALAVIVLLILVGGGRGHE